MIKIKLIVLVLKSDWLSCVWSHCKNTQDLLLSFIISLIALSVIYSYNIVRNLKNYLPSVSLWLSFYLSPSLSLSLLQDTTWVTAPASKFMLAIMWVIIPYMGYFVICWVVSDNPALLGWQLGPEREHACNVTPDVGFPLVWKGFWHWDWKSVV